MRAALVFGATGQDGSYLIDLLLSKGYVVHGVVRRASTFTTGRIEGARLNPNLHLHFGDLSDGTGLRRILEAAEPDEVYNLGAQSHVRVSFDQPEYTADIVATGTLRLLEAVRDMRSSIRFYQASSSEMFGASPAPQNEHTPFHPRSPYGVGKVAAHWYARNYREAYGMHVVCGILFNHTSERRGETFVCRKITRAAGRVAVGLQTELRLGNLDARRDWGYAPEFVEGMWRMMQRPSPDDYVLATGRSYSVRDFLAAAFAEVGLGYEEFVRFDGKYARPAEVDHLLGDAGKAKRDLGWEPKVGLAEMVRRMVDHDLKLAKQEQMILKAGEAT